LPADIAVILPPALLPLFPGCPRRLTLPAATVADAINALEARFPGMADRLRDSRPAIRRHITVFVAGERAGLQSPIPPGAEVFICTAVSGG